MKGSVSVSVVAAFIILGAVVVLGTVYLLIIAGAFSKTEAKARCAAEIAAHSATVRFTNDLKAPKITCPTERLSAQPDEAHEVIADAMVSCWDMWGRGQHRVFSGDGRYCYVCSTIEIEEPVENFGTYLDETNVKPLGPTYAQYLVERRSGQYFAQESQEQATALPAGTMGVIFYYAKGQKAIDAAVNALLGPPAQGATVGAVAGGAVAFYVVSFVGGPVTIGIATAGGIVAGGYSGFFASLLGKESLDTFAITVVRPLTQEDITRLGCEYAPVANA